MINEITSFKIDKKKYILTINSKIYIIDEFLYQIILPYEKKVLTPYQMLDVIAFSNAFDQLKYLYKKIFNHSISQSELYFKLLNKNIEKDYIDIIIKTFKKEGYLKDEDYINHYKEIYQLKKGKKALKRFLLSKKINENVIDRCLLDYQEDKEYALEIANKMVSNNKTSSNILLKNKIKASLINKGFSEESIAYVFDNLNFIDEHDILKKQIIKLKQKYDDEIIITKKLASKGYNINDIKKVMREVKESD